MNWFLQKRKLSTEALVEVIEPVVSKETEFFYLRIWTLMAHFGLFGLSQFLARTQNEVLLSILAFSP